MPILNTIIMNKGVTTMVNILGFVTVYDNVYKSKKCPQIFYEYNTCFYRIMYVIFVHTFFKCNHAICFCQVQKIFDQHDFSFFVSRKNRNILHT